MYEHVVRYNGIISMGKVNVLSRAYIVKAPTITTPTTAAVL